MRYDCHPQVTHKIWNGSGEEQEKHLQTYTVDILAYATDDNHGNKRDSFRMASRQWELRIRRNLEISFTSRQL
jgi:hypothetical protein